MTPEQIPPPPRIKAWPWNGKRISGQWHVAGLGETTDYVRGDLFAAQAAELATLRAERDALKSGILSSAGVEYILDHPMETDVERMGRHSAVRGMMVRLGLYPQLEQAIDDAIALKGGA